MIPRPDPRRSASLLEQGAGLLCSLIRPVEVNEADEATYSRVQAARARFRDYVSWMKPDYKLNWHHEAICDFLQRFIDGQIKRAVLAMPPQHGKSEYGSRLLPSYILGKYPDDRVMNCSYGADLASLINRDVQNLIDSDTYAAVFPDTRLWNTNVRTLARGRALRNSDLFEIVGRKGAYKSAGIGGAIAGMPFKWGIIDDPIKNQAEAFSLAYRRKVWGWYGSVFARRQSKDARILIVTTRWHEEDLVGMLLALQEREPHADKWEVMEFPGIALAQCAERDPRQEGEPLWPAQYPLEYYLAARAEMGAYLFSAVVQQQPSPAEGLVFKREHFRYFTIANGDDGPCFRLGYNLPGMPPPLYIPCKECIFFQTADTASTVSDTASYTCVATYAYHPPTKNLLVYHIWRGKLEMGQVIGALYELRIGVANWNPAEGRWNVRGHENPWPFHTAFQAVESKSSGIGVIQQGRKDGKPFRELKTGQQSKEARAIPIVTAYENGQVWHMADAMWLGALEKELLSFPTGANDDQVDCMAYCGILTATDPLLRQGVYGRDLLVWPPPAVDADGNPLVPEAARIGPEVYKIGGHNVVFDDDKNNWWQP